MPPETIRSLFARVLRARREELGLSQEQAAGKSGLSTRYWRSLEAAEPSVSLEVVQQLLPSLDWSWRDLAAALEPREQGALGAPTSMHDKIDSCLAREFAWHTLCAHRPHRRATNRIRDRAT